MTSPIQLKLSHWLGESRPTPMIQQMDALTGAPEYQVRVRSSIGDHTRHVCEVECLHPSKPSIHAMADTMTGSLYKDGVCLSGDLHFVGNARKTGRAVQSWAVRQRQGQQIVALSNTVVTEVTE
jgi:hypothetical protein